MAALLPALAAGPVVSSDAGAQADLFVGAESLSREAFIGHVLDRNPTVEAARQAWQEALAVHPQVISLADPMVSLSGAPGSIGSAHGAGQMVQLSQRFEWPGKQALRGAIALAEADARSADLQRVRSHLGLTASILFDDHYVVRRALEINEEHVLVLTRLQRSAEAQYIAGRGSQSDPLQADVELALLEAKRLQLVARQRVIAAQINGMLHRAPDAVLPPAPDALVPTAAPEGSSSQWAQRAQHDRPELQAATRRVAARRSGVDLAARAFLPDFSLGGSYNSMWPMPEHRLMVGISLNIPIAIGAKRGGVDQAKAALAGAQAVHAEQLDDVRVEVAAAWVRLEEAIAHATLYRERILPAARRQVAAAEAGYESGRERFSDIMAAERRLRSFEQAYEESIANTWRRRAVLARSVGETPLQDGGAS